MVINTYYPCSSHLLVRNGRRCRWYECFIRRAGWHGETVMERVPEGVGGRYAWKRTPSALQFNFPVAVRNVSRWEVAIKGELAPVRALFWSFKGKWTREVEGIRGYAYDPSCLSLREVSYLPGERLGVRHGSDGLIKGVELKLLIVLMAALVLFGSTFCISVCNILFC